MKDFGSDDRCPAAVGKNSNVVTGLKIGRQLRQNQQKISILAAFDTTDLVKTFAALTILPKNHYKIYE